jgi:tRNA A37 N6-isopentenylltransferase MiaA
MVRRDAYLLAGPTASGKSAAAALLARRMGAAILSADSMLVYKGMDVGTAKPSADERAEFSMGGIDLVTPAEHFSSGAWLRAAARWLAAVPAERPVVIVGGTGLYFSALLRGLDRKWTLPPPAYPVLQLDRAVLHARIAARLDEMLAGGAWIGEVKRLLVDYPAWSDTAQVAIGYREIAAALEADKEFKVFKEFKVLKEFKVGTVVKDLKDLTDLKDLKPLTDLKDLNPLKEKILVRTRQLAKRQDTWFRHQATPLYVQVGDTAEETAENVWRTWQERGPWQVSLPEEGEQDAS